MTDNPFSKFLPGFDFLQGLAKNAGTQMPGIGQWVAPTLNPEELDKRIAELRAVQFWLDQNAKMLSVTIQALEVQRMTLSTLKTMNVPMGDLSEALKAKSFVMPTAAPQAAPAPAPAPEPAPAPAARKAAPKKTAASKAGDAATPAAIDPLKWWGALSEQFGHLAAGAVKEIGGAAAAVAAPAAAKKTASTASAKKKT